MTLCEVRGINSIFELLEMEREKIFTKYFEVQEKKQFNLEPSHSWKIEKLDRQMIKSDDPFVHNNAVWKIGVTYHRQKDATLNINLNMVVNPFQDKKAKVYFKKNEFFVQSNYQMAGDQHAIELFAETDGKSE